MIRRIKKNIRKIYHSISFKLFLLLFLLLIIFFGLQSVFYSMMQTQIYETTIGQSAYRSSDLIKKSLYRMMLRNEREDLYYTLLQFSDEPGVEIVRIYNKRGEIMYSSKESERGNIVDMKAEACYACHAAYEPLESLPMQKKTRIYLSPDGRRIMGLINPIRNSRECSSSACHAHQPDQTILGVLDVQMSLDELDQVLSQTQLKVYSISIGIILVAIIVFAIVVYLIIYRPVRTLQTGTVKLSVGDLDYRINMQRQDEFGMLAHSFNNMAENLKRAYNELKEWSDKLAERVKDKTNELEQIHKSMIQVEKMASLGKLTASVAHELNNPLAGIVTYAKLLEKKVRNRIPEGEDQEKMVGELELIRSESIRCGNIVRNLLAFARGTSANFQEVYIENIIDRSMEIIRHHMQLAGVEAERNILTRNPKIFCDPDQLIQALIALFVNAIEAMPSGGKLRVSVEDVSDSKDEIILTIQDTGAGIPEEVRDKIFEPFYSTKKDKKGVGLGLPVVYGIIQRHKGKIWVDSIMHQGTSFHIQIPVYQRDNEK